MSESITSITLNVSEETKDSETVSLVTIVSICEKVKASLQNQEISQENIMSVIHTVMETIETFNAVSVLKGNQKKKLALECLNWLVKNNCSLEEEKKKNLLFIVNQVAPPAIDLIISIANGASQLIKKYMPECCKIS